MGLVRLVLEAGGGHFWLGAEDGGRYLCSFVFGCGDEVGAVGRPLEICNLHSILVGLNTVEEFAGLAVILRYPAILVASDDIFRKIAPACDSCLAFLAGDGHGSFITLLSVDIDFNRQHHDCS